MEEQIFSSIVKILKKSGKKIKKRVGYWYLHEFDGGFTMVLDDLYEFISVDSGLAKYSETKKFGDKVKVELFLGCPGDIQVDAAYLTRIKKKLQE